MPITHMTKIKHLECKIEEQADKLNKCNSFIRTLKSLSKKGEDISYLLENHNAKYLQIRYNKYDLIFNEFNNYYGALENIDETTDINHANQILINKIEEIFEKTDTDMEEYEKESQLRKDKSQLTKICNELLSQYNSKSNFTIKQITDNHITINKLLNDKLQIYIENQDFIRVDKCNEGIKLLSNLKE
tara:strand:- start:349 stop:912 length:564 start_codon:yes stop_codon:yes gene_type:complete